MPLDKYSIYKMIGNKSMFRIAKAISNLQQKGYIHIVSYKKNTRTGISIPMYSVTSCPGRELELDTRDVLSGVTSERYVEYEFALGNLISHNMEASILDVGCSTFTLSSEIRKFSRKRWQIIGIDIANEVSSRDFPLILMDARKMGFRNETFDQVICLSTMEHIGLDKLGYETKTFDSDYGVSGDILAMTEICRVLKPKGTVIVTVPYGNLIIKRQGYRVYYDESLSILTSKFLILKKKFFVFKKGLWEECGELEANNSTELECSNQKFHSDIFACLLLGKK